jgi:hypothetical protein
MVQELQGHPVLVFVDFDRTASPMFVPTQIHSSCDDSNRKSWIKPALLHSSDQFMQICNSVKHNEIIVSVLWLRSKSVCMAVVFRAPPTPSLRFPYIGHGLDNCDV